MKNLAIIGKGTHELKFSWEENMTSYSVKYRFESRQELGKLLRRFYRVNKEMSREYERTHEAIKLYSKELSLKYIASKKPECRIKTRDRLNRRAYQKKYSFNYTLRGIETIRNILYVVKGIK